MTDDFPANENVRSIEEGPYVLFSNNSPIIPHKIDWLVESRVQCSDIISLFCSPLMRDTTRFRSSSFDSIPPQTCFIWRSCIEKLHDCVTQPFRLKRLN
jgi:hypothetical protein